MVGLSCLRQNKVFAFATETVTYPISMQIEGLALFLFKYLNLLTYKPTNRLKFPRKIYAFYH